jgi:hypothetical protein
MRAFVAEAANIIVPAQDKAYFEQASKRPHTVENDAQQKAIMNCARMHAKMALRRLPLLYKNSLRAKQLGDIVLDIDRLRLFVLGNLLQALLLLRIRRRLGGTLGARGLVAKIISGRIDISCHDEATGDRGIRSPSPHLTSPPKSILRQGAADTPDLRVGRDACHQARRR